MPITEDQRFDLERVRAEARILQFRAADACDVTEHLMQENLQWHRDALAISQRTQELVRTRVESVHPAMRLSRNEPAGTD